ncbi:ComEC/Rec2 family competence protein [Nonlabens sp. SY33080]|uniref:ComEC/Rec2 family competence protein n=1 Tax=Nonlabens sp. SY33080 TaxID=2719911 RepID=UPI001428AC90|nr:ComEC/Rec2 family competence protein [Nonlabens sp. SY33080]
MRYLSYPFFKLLIAFVIGIVIATFFKVQSVFIYGLLSSSLCLLAITIFFKGRSKPFKWLGSLSVIVLFVSLGFWRVQQEQFLPENHYVNQGLIGSEAVIELELYEQLASNQFNDRYYARVRNINATQSTGNVLVLFKTTDSLEFTLGHKLWVYDDINLPSNARNPGDFNYGKYLEGINVHGQIYIDKDKILKQELPKSSDLSFFIKVRKRLETALYSSEMSKQPIAMIEALLLGQRKHLDKEITVSFRKAGVIHILALSGLHVGIILLIIEFLTRPLQRWNSYGAYLQTIVILIVLWSFALMTGMSPSIMRAVTMFSFVAIGMTLSRRTNTYFSLMLSAIVLLLINPRLIFNVGFQLSYAAVFAIVTLQPLFKSLWFPRNRVLRFLFSIFTVTLAAQIGVAPISLFYFHQFPLGFLIGNMVLLPALPIFLAASILMMALLVVCGNAFKLDVLLNFILEWVIDFIHKVGSWDFLLIEHVYLELWQVILLYFILYGTALFVSPVLSRSKKERLIPIKPNNFLHLSLFSVLLCLVISTISTLTKDSKVLILHQAAGSAISVYNNHRAQVFTDFYKMTENRDSITWNRLRWIEPHRDREVLRDSLHYDIKINELELVIIKEDGFYRKTHNQPIVLLTQSARVNLERLINEVRPTLIIADGSNYRSNFITWESTCLKYNIPFINTYEEGAVELSY